MFLHVMVCRELGNVRWTELHRSLDNGGTWRPTGTRWRADHLGGHFQMLTWERDGGYVYAFTTGFQRDKGLLLSRVPETAVTDVRAWETWGLSADGWGWGRPPTVVLPGRFGELSLRRVEDTWVLVLFDDGNYRMDVLVLDSPDRRPAHRAPRHRAAGCGLGRRGPRRGPGGPALRRLRAARQHAGRAAPRREPVEHHDELALPRHAVCR